MPVKKCGEREVSFTMIERPLAATYPAMPCPIWMELLILVFTCVLNATANFSLSPLRNSSDLCVVLKDGVLKIETPYSDSDFEVEWLHVKAFNSKRTFTMVLVKLLGH